MTHSMLSAVIAVKVVTAGLCPSAEQVDKQLQALEHDPHRQANGEEVRVDDDNSGIRLTWFSADGNPTFSKVVVAPVDCEKRARAAALVIASHQAQLPSIRASTTNVSSFHARQHESIDANRLYFAAGAGGTDGARPSAAALVEVGLHRPARLFAFASRLRASFPVEATVGEGEARYWRLIPSLALRQRLVFRSLAFDLHQEMALIVTRAEGRGFEKNYGATSALAAVGGGVKVEYAMGGRYSVWCDVTWLMALGRDNLFALDRFGGREATGLPSQHWWVLIGLQALL